MGWAFAIWGMIYTLEAVYCLYQAFPRNWDTPLLASIRPYVLLAFVSSACWTFLFGNNRFWLALVAIVTYEVALLKILSVLACDFFDTKHPWYIKLCVVSGFSLNAAWVFVASSLQMHINLLAEGWLPSADFAAGTIALVTAAACYNVFVRADLVYAFGSAWALVGVIANQQSHEGSLTSGTWGTVANVCSQKCLDTMKVCAEGSTLPKAPAGYFYEQCVAYVKSGVPKDNEILVSTSTEVVQASQAAIVLVVLALLSAIVHTCVCKRNNRERDGEGDALIGTYAA